MHTPQNEVLLLIYILDALRRGAAPSQEHYACCAHLRDGVDHLLSQELPALAGVRVSFAGPDSQARIEEQDAAVRPWRQQTALIGWSLEVGVVFLEGLVDVLEGWWGVSRWADGEAEPVGLIGAVIGILTGDDGLDGVERRVTRPARSWSAIGVHEGSI